MPPWLLEPLAATRPQVVIPVFYALPIAMINAELASAIPEGAPPCPGAAQLPSRSPPHILFPLALLRYMGATRHRLNGPFRRFPARPDGGLVVWVQMAADAVGVSSIGGYNSVLHGPPRSG